MCSSDLGGRRVLFAQLSMFTHTANSDRPKSICIARTNQNAPVRARIRHHSKRNGRVRQEGVDSRKRVSREEGEEDDGVLPLAASLHFLHVS